MPGLGSNVSPSVPRASSSENTRKRCPARAPEAWEDQKPVVVIGGAWDFKAETPEEYLAFMEDWQKKHGWMREDQEPYDPEAGKYLGPHEGAKVLTGDELRARAAAMDGSSLSWTSADPPVDASNEERNSNRQQAPVGWEAGAGQERTAVMGILGGRKR